MDLNDPNTKEVQPRIFGNAGGQDTISQPTRADTYRQHLDLVVEDVAGKLEKKARQIRTVSGLCPKDITQEQFDAMLVLICNMR